MRAKTVEDLLANKVWDMIEVGTAPYQSSPDFPGVVYFLNLLAKYYNMPSITFAQLEEALDRKESGPGSKWTLRKRENFVLEEFFTKLIQTLPPYSKPGMLNMYLYYFAESHLFYFEDGKNPFGPVFRDDSNVTALSNENKLRLLRALLYEKVAAILKMKILKLRMKVENVIDAQYTLVELRPEPLAVDSKGRVFWYFGDLYMFVELETSRAENSEHTPSTLNVNDFEENTDFTSHENLTEFRIVCKTLNDWEKLIAAFELEIYATDKEVARILNEKLKEIREIERKKHLVEKEKSPLNGIFNPRKRKLVENEDEPLLFDPVKDKKNEARQERFLRRQSLWIERHCNEDSEFSSDSPSTFESPENSSESQLPLMKRLRRNTADYGITNDLNEPVLVGAFKSYSDTLTRVE